MKSNFGKVVVALEDKADHAAILLQYIASACKYKKESFYSTKKGNLAYMLRVTGLKHKNSYRRAITKLVKLGLIHKLETPSRRSGAMYMLTDKTVKFAEKYKENKNTKKCT